MSTAVDSQQSQPSIHNKSQYNTQATPTHYNASTTSTTSKQLDDWYLKVAVGGRRNFLFLEDNLTPAPYHIEQQPQPPEFDDISNADDAQVISIEGQITTANIEPLNLSTDSTADIQVRPTSIDQSDNTIPSPSSQSLNQQLEQSSIGGSTVSVDASAPASPQNRGQSKTPPLTPIIRGQIQTRSQNESGRINANSGGSAIEASQNDSKPSSDSTSQLQSLTLDSTVNSAANSRPQSASMRNTPNTAMTPRTKRRLSDVVCNSGLSVYLHAGFGQDSYFVACDANQQGKTAMVLGIADGVGGWRSSGVDSGIMSRAIMRTALNYVREGIAHGGIDTTSAQYQASTPSHRGHTYSNTASLNSQSMELDEEPTHHRRQSDKQYDETSDFNYSSILADPRELMAKAYYQVKAENTVPAGSTTACIVTLLPVYANQQQNTNANTTTDSNKVFPMFSDVSTPNSTAPSTPSTRLGIQPSNQDYVIMRAANLGDSGYIVVRFAKNGTGDNTNNIFPFRPHVVGFTPFQRDESNVVKQLAVIPESIASSNEYYEYCDDKPEEATTSEHKLLDGDIIILASDGLWDNFNLESEHYVNLPYGYNNTYGQSGNQQQQNMMRMRVQQHINDQDRIRRQHQIIERIVMESLTNTPSAFVTARDSPRQESLNSKRRNSMDAINTVPEIDPAALCARLMQHSLEFQRKPDGKPDDLTIMVTQLRRRKSTLSL